MLRQPGLEHEGHGSFQLVRLWFRGAGLTEGVGVRAVRQHAVVEREAARHEAGLVCPRGLGVVLAVHQAHEPAHDVHVVPGRPERVLGHQPAVGEADEAHINRPRLSRQRGEHREDAGVRVVEQQRPHGRVAAQGVLIRRVVAVQGHHVQRQGVGVDRAALRQGKGAAVVLAHVAAGRLVVSQFHPELHAAGHDGDLARLDVDDAEFGPQPQAAMLGHEQHLAVGVPERLVLHGPGRGIDVRGHAEAAVSVAGGGHGAHAGEPGERVLRDQQRVPAQGLYGQIGHLPRGRGAPEAADVPHRGADAVEPAPLVRRAAR